MMRHLPSKIVKVFRQAECLPVRAAARFGPASGSPSVLRDGQPAIGRAGSTVRAPGGGIRPPTQGGRMAIDQQGLDEFRKTLEADDYHLAVHLDGDAADARIEAGPEACAECLVPKEFMAQMLAPLLGVGAERIAVTYPVEVHTAE
jgi:hypothetical protein